MVKTMSYGGFWIRFLAYIIDAIILTAVARILFSDNCSGVGYCASYEGWQVIIPIAYYIGFWSWKSATPGKMVCKLRIVEADGKPLRPQTAVIRFLSYFVSTVALCIGFIWIGFDEKKQGWHDKLAKTYVVKA